MKPKNIKPPADTVLWAVDQACRELQVSRFELCFKIMADELRCYGWRFYRKEGGGQKMAVDQPTTTDSKRSPAPPTSIEIEKEEQFDVLEEMPIPRSRRPTKPRLPGSAKLGNRKVRNL